MIKMDGDPTLTGVLCNGDFQAPCLPPLLPKYAHIRSLQPLPLHKTQNFAVLFITVNSMVSSQFPKDQYAPQNSLMADIGFKWYMAHLVNELGK